jgi:hypothetical protein
LGLLLFPPFQGFICKWKVEEEDFVATEDVVVVVGLRSMKRFTALLKGRKMVGVCPLSQKEKNAFQCHFGTWVRKNLVRS